jgi:ABC-type nickel/cobalt efflux system permease component RcnA
LGSDSLLARQQGWSHIATARAAAIAGLGHTLSTLAIALVVWLAGTLAAARFGHAVGLISDLALIAFGAWIALGALREIHSHSGRDGEHARFGHTHDHRHASGLAHRHWHAHQTDSWHAHPEDDAPTPGGNAPEHAHEHATSSRTALLLILGSSPMVEGIPAFLAATRYGVTLLVVMAVVFAIATITTYVGLVLASTLGLQRVNLGPLERYGEVLSGAFIALVGLVFLIWPAY